MAPATPLSSCSYELDDQLRIISVDPAWTAFALENDAPELVPPAPYGRPVWSYMADAATMHLWHQLFDKVTQTGRAIDVAIRCDSPALKRFLSLHVSKRPISGLRVDSRVVRLEPRESVALLEPGHSHSDEMLRMCSWCKRVALDGGWADVEEVTSALRLFERERLPSITHGMCPECQVEVNALLSDDQ